MAEFGALWFGGFETFGLAPELARRATKAPAVYGLHATFKAPFPLRDDVAPEALRDALDDFCANRRAPAAGRLILGHHQRYLTLMLNGLQADIDWLATECVTHFDHFRAPLDEEDDARRELDGLSQQEEAFLKEFGYPYVLSAFRFHISLAGPLESAELDEVAKALEPQSCALYERALRDQGFIASRRASKRRRFRSDKQAQIWPVKPPQSFE